MKNITYFIVALLLSANMRGQDCPPVSPPFSFDSEVVSSMLLPECFISTAYGPTSHTWVQAENPNAGFSGHVMEYEGTDIAADSWLFTRGIALTAGVNYRVNYKYANSSTLYTESFSLTYGLTPDAASARVLSNVSNLSDAVVHTGNFSYFTVSVTGTYYFGFHATSMANQGSIYVDDFSIAPSTCGVPGNLQVTNITTTGATLNWGLPVGGNVNPTNIYQYVVSESSETPASGTMEYTTTRTLTTLQPGKTYHAFVRALCGGSLWGEWASTTFTTTPCETATVPYTQDFESAIVPSVPECNSVANEGGNSWTTTSMPGNGFNSNTLRYISGTETGTAWYFTRGIQLEEGHRYKVSFRYGNNNGGTTEKLQVSYGLSASAQGMTNNVVTLNNITGGIDATSSTGPIPIGTSGVYYIGFKALSDADQGSLYIDDIVIEEWTCATPSNLTITDITTTSATFSWEASTSEVQFYQHIVTEIGAPTPDGGPNVTQTTATSNIPLQANSMYTAYVRAFCSGVWSDWVSINFLTPMCSEVAQVPFSIPFSDANNAAAMPDCYTMQSGPSSAPWQPVAAPGHGFDTPVLQYSGNTWAEGNTWFYTQGIHLVAGVYYKISFDYGNSSPDTTENMRVVIGRSPNGTLPGSFYSNNYEVTGGSLQTQELNFVTVQQTSTYFIGFKAESPAGNGSLYLDNIIVEEAVCGGAANLSLSDITTTSVTASWQKAGNALVNVYMYAISTNGSQAPAETQFTNNLSAAFGDLNPGTTYYVYVRSLCGPLMSDWSVESFTTPACNATTVPYTLDFEWVSVPTLPDCTTTVTGEGSGSWATSNASGNGFDSKILQFTGNDAIADAWFFTQGIVLEAGKRYRITFKYGNDSQNTIGKLKFTMNTNPNSEWIVAPGIALDEYEITGGTPATAEFNFVNVTDTGIYYFGFNAYSDAGQGNIYVDDFSITEVTCGDVANLTVSDITQTSATATWESGGTTPVSVYLYGISTAADTVPATISNTSSLTAALNDLQPATTYYLHVRSVCGPLMSEWVIIPFTTDDSTNGTGSETFSKLVVYPNPADNIVTIKNSTTIDAVAVQNLSGQLVFKKQVQAETVELQTSAMATGVYLLTIYSGNETQRVKLIRK